MSVVKSQSDPFLIERLRNIAALQDDKQKFKALYASRFKAIPNLNTRIFWDKRIRQKIGGVDKENITRVKVEFVANFLRHKIGNVLDIGFGYLDLEKRISKLAPHLHLYGIDISNYAVEEAKRIIRGEFKVGSISRIPYNDNCFDIVVVLDVLEHIPPNKTFKAYKEVRRVLKKGGIFIVSVPLNEPLERMVKKGKNPNGHVRIYTPDILRMELIIFSFKVLKEKYFYAFKIFYALKNFLIKFLSINFRKPNLMVVIASKK